MKVLELFAGSHIMSDTFKKRGHTTYTIDQDESWDGIDWYADINTITAQDIIERFGKSDVIWASPDCATYSVAAISRHRKKEKNGNLAPVSDYAKFCDATNEHVINLIKELDPKYYFIENPRGALRKMNFMAELSRYTVTYCQYGFTYMKPTDIWTNHPDPRFKPACKNGDPCHESAPRGASSGLQKVDKRKKAQIPTELCEHIVDICED